MSKAADFWLGCEVIAPHESRKSVALTAVHYSL